MWLICCLVIAIYPQFPVVGQTPLPAVCALSSFFTSLLIFWISTFPMLSSTKVLFRYHSALHLLATTVVIFVDAFRDYKVRISHNQMGMLLNINLFSRKFSHNSG